MKVVICGAGVIGAATAFYLAERGIGATLVEACAPACAASGKSGGFLALDWCDGSAMAKLARRSFELHRGLGERFGVRTGYREMDTLAMVASEGVHDLAAYAKLPAPAWLDGNCAIPQQLGSVSSTAQVHPGLLTHTLLQEAAAAGATVLTGKVSGVRLEGKRVNGVRVDGEMLYADAVVIAMGPWSTHAGDWLPLPPISGEKGASIVLKPSAPVSAHALFGQFLDAHGQVHDPEVFPRPDGTVYMCGAPDRAPLPDDASRIAPTPDAERLLRGMAAGLSTQLAEAAEVSTQACYRPVVSDGLPVMGRVPGIEGAYVATAHNCWGILNAPASGEAMAELITSGATTHLGLDAFDPQRLM